MCHRHCTILIRKSIEALYVSQPLYFSVSVGVGHSLSRQNDRGDLCDVVLCDD